MANEEHVSILRLGSREWNVWRQENPGIRPDLSGVHLGAAGLSGTNFSGVDLSSAKLVDAELSSCSFENADLSGTLLGNANLLIASLKNAILSKASLFNASFIGASLECATLEGADLRYADFRDSTLQGANLRSALLENALLNGADLADADLQDAQVGYTSFGDTDLSRARGLESLKHTGPSVVGVATFYRSGGVISETFLRSCGVPDAFITQIPALVAAVQPIQYYSCFISYSSKDEGLAHRLYADLQAKGVPCFFAPEDMKIGDRFRRCIDEAIRVHDRLLLLLSEHSVTSSWVEKEVETAMESEAEQNRTVIFPVRLDGAVMEIKVGWPADVRRTRHIGDFSRWKEHDEYRKAFDRLLSDLKAET